MKRYINMLFTLLPFVGWAQPDSLSMEDAIQYALKNNKRVMAASQQVFYQSQLKKTSSELPKTEVGFMYGQYNSILKDNNITVMQTIPFPTVFSSKNSYHKALLETSKAQQSSTINELIFQVKDIYFRAYSLYGKKKILVKQDSIYKALQAAVTKRVQAGEETTLQVMKTTASLQEVENTLHQVNSDIEILESQLQAILNQSSPVNIKNRQPVTLNLTIPEMPDPNQNPNIQIMRYQLDAAENLKKLERAKALPEFKIGFFTQTLTGFQNINGTEQYFGSNKRFNGLQGGIGIPLWFFPHVSQVKANDYGARRAEAELEQTKIDWMAQLQKAHQMVLKNKLSLDYYNTSGLPMANLIQSQAVASYKQGEISISELLLSFNQALAIQESYWETLLNYNLSIIHIEFLIGQKS